MDDQPLIKEDEMDLQVEGGTTLPINETQMIIEKPAGGPVSKQQAEKTESGKEKGLKLENCRAFGKRRIRWRSQKNCKRKNKSLENCFKI